MTSCSLDLQYIFSKLFFYLAVYLISFFVHCFAPMDSLFHDTSFRAVKLPDDINPNSTGGKKALRRKI